MEERIITRVDHIPTLPKRLALSERKRVAAYARVSTSSDEQLNSIDAQKSYYKEYIRKHKNWIYVGLFADEGISGLSHFKRTEFNRMIADAESGYIDIIITKSISRFARNTVDTLTYIRRLKEKGVAVYFEKEDINTLDAKGEFIITLLSSTAQEESRSISENVKWGIRKRMADGIYHLPYSRFLGYEKRESTLAIVPGEAAAIRYIYYLFLAGKTAKYIASLLTESNISTPAGLKTWHPSVVVSILKNEKYCGNALLQKTYISDFLTKKAKKNQGEFPQYFVENDHEGIIDVDVWNEVQSMIDNRDRTYSGCSVFSHKLVCSVCGGTFIRRTRYYKSQPEAPVIFYNCRNMFNKSCKCKNVIIHETDLYSLFSETVKSLLQAESKKVLIAVKETLKICLSEEKAKEVTDHLSFAVNNDSTQRLSDMTLECLINRVVVFTDRRIRFEFRDGNRTELKIRHERKQ